MDLRGTVIAFDLDGTLVDTAPDLVGALNAVLVQERLPPLPLEAARTLVGRGAEALLRRGFAAAGADWPSDRNAALLARFIELYLARIAHESRPFDGVEAALDQLAAAGARLVVCTNKRTDLSVALLGAVGLADRFVAVVGGDYGGPMKPDGAHVLAAIEAGGGTPGRALMVGDSDNDVLAAQAAGVAAAVFTFGYCATPAAELGAEAVLDRWSDLPTAVGRLLDPRPAAIDPPLP